MSRIRHCVECPGCRTRYLVSLSPYKNGSYLVATANGFCGEYLLYCCCGRSSCWRETEVMTCEVSKAAYERGFGTENEIQPLERESQDGWPFDVSRYFSDWKVTEKRKNSA